MSMLVHFLYVSYMCAIGSVQTFTFTFTTRPITEKNCFLAQLAEVIVYSQSNAVCVCVH